MGILLSHIHINTIISRLFLSVLLIMTLCVVMWWYVFVLPYQTPGVIIHDTYVVIPNGTSARGVSDILSDNRVIRSADLFLVTVKAMRKEGSIKSGTYYFNSPQTLVEVVDRVVSADYRLPATWTTLFEGEPSFDFAERLSNQFQFVNTQEFLRLAAPHEGYLFPDTYNIPVRATSDEVVAILRDNFIKQIEPIQNEIDSSGRSLHDIITMASLIETEAGNASYIDKQKVAGVLWRRLDIGMRLQADAVFSYIFKEHLPRVLNRHLSVDSPYNIYKHPGLPPGPIGNPGIDSIRATINPIDTGNIYYLTGSDGTFHYSKTLSVHEQNRNKYIRY